MKTKYSAKTAEIKNEKGWNSLDVYLFKNNSLLGKYRRNYPIFYNTFVPFVKDGKEFALYSRHYMHTRIMELPGCKDIGGEEEIDAILGKPEPRHFCPVDYFVPYNPKNGLTGKFGFVAGCVWGDDSSWKIQFLDLSEIEKGILIRNDKFRYIELPEGISLEQAIGLRDYDADDQIIKIGNQRTFIL